MPPIITCVAALNPCFNVNGVELLIESISTDLVFFNDSYATKAKKMVQRLFGSGASSRASGGENQMTRLLNRLQEHRKKMERNDPSLSSEYERYVKLDFVTLLDNNAFVTLGKESMYHILSCMAMDIISVQATSRKQHKFDLENPIYFEEEILDAEVQQNEVIPLSEEEIALDVASSEGTMSGSGSGEKEDYRRKCEADEAAYAAKRKKQLGFLECRELEFLMIDPESLPQQKTAYIRIVDAENLLVNSEIQVMDDVLVDPGAEN
nr:hypothetical protein [Tanacetum cinerariifolium]